MRRAGAGGGSGTGTLFTVSSTHPTADAGDLVGRTHPELQEDESWRQKPGSCQPMIFEAVGPTEVSQGVHTPV